jgi:hypothetical protein
MCQLPPTRAKSPKLGRQKSNSNLSEGAKDKGVVAQRNHSTPNTNNCNLSDVNNDNGMDVLENKIEHTEIIEEINMIKLTGQADVEISSQSSVQ